MLLGAAFLLLVSRHGTWVPFALGAFAGLMTLARSDGLLWLGLAGLSVIWNVASAEDAAQKTDGQRLARLIRSGLLILVGYLLVMGFWHARNLIMFGSALTPGGGRLLWLQNYNQTFINPPEAHTRESFLQAGWDAALQSRVRALSANASNAFGAQGAIFLFPLIVVGLWQLRGQQRTRLAVTGWLLLFFVMTFVFPFAGARGSFFHAGAAFQPYWWVAAPVGLDALLAKLRARGQFADEHAPYFLQGVLVLLAVLMTAYLVNFRVIASGWAQDDVIYPAVETALLDNGIQPGDVVIVRNPPGYYIASGRPSVSLPFGDEQTILAVAQRYGARYLVLEEGGTFDSIQDLYDDPHGHPSFHFLGEVNGAKLYSIEAAR
jgi:hypothetical protein